MCNILKQMQYIFAVTFGTLSNSFYYLSINYDWLLSLALTHTYILFLSLSYTHTHTLTRYISTSFFFSSLSVSLTLFLSFTLFLFFTIFLSFTFYLSFSFSPSLSITHSPSLSLLLFPSLSPCLSLSDLAGKDEVYSSATLFPHRKPFT